MQQRISSRTKFDTARHTHLQSGRRWVGAESYYPAHTRTRETAETVTARSKQVEKTGEDGGGGLRRPLNEQSYPPPLVCTTPPHPPLPTGGCPRRTGRRGLEAPAVRGRLDALERRRWHFVARVASIAVFSSDVAAGERHRRRSKRFCFVLPHHKSSSARFRPTHARHRNPRTQRIRAHTPWSTHRPRE